MRVCNNKNRGDYCHEEGHFNPAEATSYRNETPQRKSWGQVLLSRSYETSAKVSCSTVQQNSTFLSISPWLMGKSSFFQKHQFVFACANRVSWGLLRFQSFVVKFRWGFRPYKLKKWPEAQIVRIRFNSFWFHFDIFILWFSDCLHTWLPVFWNNIQILFNIGHSFVECKTLQVFQYME